MVELDDADARTLGHFLDVRRSYMGTDQGGLAIERVQCGKPITGEGIGVTVEERWDSLCCPSCESVFRDEYESLRTAADAE